MKFNHISILNSSFKTVLEDDIKYIYCEIHGWNEPDKSDSVKLISARLNFDYRDQIGFNFSESVSLADLLNDNRIIDLIEEMQVLMNAEYKIHKN